MDLSQRLLLKETSKKVNTPSNEIIQRILENTQWAPTGDNCQAFSYVWEYGLLKIYCDFTKDQHAFNSNKVASYLNLGATIEYLSIASLHEGYKIKVFHNKSSKQESLLATIQFIKTQKVSNNYFKMLKKRSTDRRNFKGGDISTIELIANNEITNKEIEVVGVSSKNKKLINIMGQTEATIVKWKQATVDLFKWLRLTSNEVNDSNDGLTYKNLGVIAFDILMIRLLRKFIKFHSLLSPFSAIKYKLDTLKSVKSSAGILCFSTSKTDPKGLVDFARTATRTWLSLNEKGYAVHPLSQSSLLVTAAHMGQLPENCPNKIKSSLSKNWGELKSIFGFANETRLFWTFRVGINPPLPNDLRSKRNKPILHISNSI